MMKSGAVLEGNHLKHRLFALTLLCCLISSGSAVSPMQGRVLMHCLDSVLGKSSDLGMQCRSMQPTE